MSANETRKASGDAGSAVRRPEGELLGDNYEELQGENQGELRLHGELQGEQHAEVRGKRQQGKQGEQREEQEQVDETSADERGSGSEVEVFEQVKADGGKSRKRARPRENVDVVHMRVADLKAELKKRGLKTGGNKPELLNRLLDAMERENASAELQSVPVPETIDLSESPVKSNVKPALPAPSAGADDLKTGGRGEHGAADGVVCEKPHRFSLVNETAHTAMEMPLTNHEAEILKEVAEPPTSSSHTSEFDEARASLPGLGKLDNKDAQQRDTHSIDGSRMSETADFAEAAAEEVVPSSYVSPRATADARAGEHLPIEQEPPKQLAPSEEAPSASILLSPAPLVKGSVAWLHSRAKNAFKVLTENTIDSSSSNTSLLARGFRALQGAMVPENAPDTIPAEQGSAEKSASVEKEEVSSPSADSPLLLPLSERLHSRKVGFVHTNAVETSADESQHNESNFERTTGGSPLDNDAASNVRLRSVSLPKADLAADGSHKLAKTPDTTVLSTIADKAKSAEADKSDEANRLREFQESVEREAQRLRLAAKQSAKKRLEESKAKAYWDQSEKLKQKLQAQATSVSTLEVPSSSKSGFVEEALVSLEASRPEPSVTESSAPRPTSFKPISNSKPQAHAQSATSGRPRADSMSSTVSSVTSSTGVSSDPNANSAAGDKRVLSNLVSGVHSFATLIESNKAASSTNSTRAPPVVNALKLAEKTKQLEEKKRLEKIRRKEAMKKKYEEQRRQDEEKKRLAAEAKGKAEQEAKQKREQERLQEKKQREQELAQKRMKKLQEMRAGLAKKRAEEQQRKEAAKAATSAAPQHSTKQLVPPAPPTKVRPARPPRRSSTKPSAKEIPPAPAVATHPAGTASSKAPAKAQAVTAAPASAPAKKPAAAAAISYDMSDKSESDNDSVSDDNDHKRRRRDAKDIPEWARRENLDKILRVQFGPNAIDPSPLIFPDFADTCDLEAIFDASDERRKKRFGRRTSSGNWSGDRPTTRDQALYRQDMGFGR